MQSLILNNEENWKVFSYFQSFLTLSKLILEKKKGRGDWDCGSIVKCLTSIQEPYIWSPEMQGIREQMVSLKTKQKTKKQKQNKNLSS